MLSLQQIFCFRMLLCVLKTALSELKYIIFVCLDVYKIYNVEINFENLIIIYLGDSYSPFLIV